MKKLGIDFGTCYIKCYDVEREELMTLDTETGGASSERLANVITYKTGQTPVVGEPNYMQKKTDDIIVTNIKSNLLKETWSVTLPDGSIKYSFHVVKDIMLYLYEKMIEDNPYETEYEAVITMPVNFSERQKEIIRRAASDVGFVVQDVISEPFAALFYLMNDEMESNHNVLVIDIGGGTLDMCLTKIDVSDGISIVTEATNGINFGGNLLDEEIAKFLMLKHQELENTLTKNEVHENAWNKLKLLYEIKDWKGKIYAEDFDEEEDNEREIYFTPFKGNPMDLMLSAEDVKHVLQDMEIDKKIEAMLDALFDNSESVTCDDVTDIFMVGGSTMIPYFEEYARNYFIKEMLDADEDKISQLFALNDELDIEEKTVGCVANGAGLYMLKRSQDEINIVNNIPTQIYTKSLDDKVGAECNLEQTKYGDSYTPNYALVSKMNLQDGYASVYQTITVNIDGADEEKEEVYIGKITVTPEIRKECECYFLNCDAQNKIYAEFGNYEGKKKEDTKFVAKYGSKLLFDLV